MVRKTLLAFLLMGLILALSVSCAAQTEYVYQPWAEAWWLGASINGEEPPADLDNTYMILQRPKGETDWANADTVAVNIPHTIMGREHTQMVQIVNGIPGTYEHLVIFLAKDPSTGEVVAAAECQTNDVVFLGETEIPDCGIRR